MGGATRTLAYKQFSIWSTAALWTLPWSSALTEPCCDCLPTRPDLTEEKRKERDVKLSSQRVLSALIVSIQGASTVWYRSETVEEEQQEERSSAGGLCRASPPKQFSYSFIYLRIFYLFWESHFKEEAEKTGLMMKRFSSGQICPNALIETTSETSADRAETRAAGRPGGL